MTPSSAAPCPSGPPGPAFRGAASPVAISWAEMVSHRAYLVRFAQRKLRDPMLAEDAVHDVFEAVLPVAPRSPAAPPCGRG